MHGPLNVNFISVLHIFSAFLANCNNYIYHVSCLQRLFRFIDWYKPNIKKEADNISSGLNFDFSGLNDNKMLHWFVQFTRCSINYIFNAFTSFRLFRLSRRWKSTDKYR
jgi:hypothetical protein